MKICLLLFIKIIIYYRENITIRTQPDSYRKTEPKQTPNMQHYNIFKWGSFAQFWRFDQIHSSSLQSVNSMLLQAQMMKALIVQNYPFTRLFTLSLEHMVHSEYITNLTFFIETTSEIGSSRLNASRKF